MTDKIESAEVGYENVVSQDRYQCVKAGLFWKIKVGDGDALYGRFISKSSAENMACLLKREFRNGAFVARSRDTELRKLRSLLGEQTASPAPYA